MLAARARLVSKQSVRLAAESVGLKSNRIAYASTVMEHAPDLVDAVISGATGLDEAYRVARERKTAADSVENQLARLRAEDSELADRVVEGELSLAGAWAERRERERKRAEHQRDARALLGRVVELLSPVSRSDGFVATWADQLGEMDTELTELIKRADDAHAMLGDLIERTRR